MWDHHQHLVQIRNRRQLYHFHQTNFCKQSFFFMKCNKAVQVSELIIRFYEQQTNHVYKFQQNQLLSNSEPLHRNLFHYQVWEFLCDVTIHVVAASVRSVPLEAERHLVALWRHHGLFVVGAVLFFRWRHQQLLVGVVDFVDARVLTWNKITNIQFFSI